MQDIPEGTIKSLSAKVAEEYQAIPLKVSNRTLHMAMVEPRNLRAIDALSFASGYRIEPWVSPELRVFQALEKYYGIPRRLRYISICRALEAGSVPQKPDLNRAPGSGLGDSSTPEGTGASGADAPPAEEPSIASALEAEAAYGYGKSWQEIADGLDVAHTPPATDRRKARPEPAAEQPRPEAQAQAKPDVTKSPAPGASRNDNSVLAELAERLCAADSAQQAIAALLDCAATSAERTMFFVVNGDSATLWDERGSNARSSAKTKVRFSVTSEPIFELLLGSSYFRGKLPSEPRYAGFYQTLTVQPPLQVLLAPVYLNDRLAGLFYADSQFEGKGLAETEDYLKLVRLFGLSLSLILLKQKIRAGAQAPEAAAGGPATAEAKNVAVPVARAAAPSAAARAESADGSSGTEDPRSKPGPRGGRGRSSQNPGAR
jgi:hypothetical protein